MKSLAFAMPVMAQRPCARRVMVSVQDSCIQCFIIYVDGEFGMVVVGFKGPMGVDDMPSVNRDGTA